MKTTLRLLALFLYFFSFHTSNATDYTFNGNGDWSVAANWQGGLMPSGPVTAGNTIFILGNASVTTTCTNCSANSLLNNSGTIIIAAGGTLTLQNLTQFMQIGSIVVNGTMINKTVLEIFTGSVLTINGTFINQNQVQNQGTISVNSGGKLENQLAAVLSGTSTSVPSATGILLINNGGTVVNKNTAVLNPGKITNNGTIENQSTLSGNTTIDGNLTNIGTLSPGSSPGNFVINGNYTAATTSVHNFELGGTTANAYDKLTVNGTVNLNGILNVTLINGFVPNADHDLPLITGNINGSFSSVYKPAKYIVIYNPNSVVLRFNVSLPMLYIHLDAKKEGSWAKLAWEIHNEPSVVTYEVERSADGTGFEKIGTVGAQMTGKYTFTDYHPRDKNFYRIKVIDVGGTHRYSSVIKLTQGKTSIALNTFPSPAQNEITVQHATSIENSKLLVTTLDGRVIKVVSPQIGAQQTKIELSSVKAGSYVMQFQNGSAPTEAMLFAKN